MRSHGTCRYMPSCTFWSWMLSDVHSVRLTRGRRPVLMHLLVLVLPPSCFIESHRCYLRSNSPCGAGCFLTGGFCSHHSGAQGRNAPSGAGCFLTEPPGWSQGWSDSVLMHLLVLGAFGPLPLGTASLRHFQGAERHRLRKHPAGPDGSAPI